MTGWEPISGFASLTVVVYQTYSLALDAVEEQNLDRRQERQDAERVSNGEGVKVLVGEAGISCTHPLAT